MKHKHQNRDLLRLNLFSLVILALSLFLAYLIWKGVIRSLDTPFGIVREVNYDTWWVKLSLYVGIAGGIELFIHKILRIKL
jgi:hypothetical protein